MELLGCGKETLVQLIIAGVIDWVIHDGLDTLRSIDGFHGDRVDASLLNLQRGLKVQHLGHAGGSNLLDIYLVQRVSTNHDVRVCNFGHEESRQEVALNLVQDSVDDVYILDTSLLTLFLFPVRAIINSWVPDIDHPLWLSLHDHLGPPVVSLLETVENVLVI